MFYFSRPSHHHRHRGKNDTSAVSLGILGALRSRGEAMGCGFLFAPLGRPEKVGGSQVETHPFAENLGTTPKIIKNPVVKTVKTLLF